MANVIIRGFDSDEQAKTFIKWFEGQGEQDQDTWFEAAGLEAQNTDCSATYPLHRDDDDNWVLELTRSKDY